MTSSFKPRKTNIRDFLQNKYFLVLYYYTFLAFFFYLNGMFFLFYSFYSILLEFFSVIYRNECNNFSANREMNK
jgi:hypothetical protein